MRLWTCLPWLGKQILTVGPSMCQALSPHGPHLSHGSHHCVSWRVALTHVWPGCLPTSSSRFLVLLLLDTVWSEAWSLSQLKGLVILHEGMYLAALGW